MRTRFIVLLSIGAALAVPASASAHAKSATVALDYRLEIDRATRSLAPVSVTILDGDRALRVAAKDATVVVRGNLREPMLRIGRGGAWVNRASITAVAEGLTKLGRGWERVSGGPSFTWHEHRLAPPPFGAQTGPVARFEIPVTVDGRPATIGGTFVGYGRPAVWPWLAACAVVAAVGSLIAFSAADAPNGRVAWLQIGLGIGLAVVVCIALLHAGQPRRAQLAGLLGAVAAALSLGSLDAVRHGVVVSLLSATGSRALLALALVAGSAAAV